METFHPRNFGFQISFPSLQRIVSSEIFPFEIFLEANSSSGFVRGLAMAASLREDVIVGRCAYNGVTVTIPLYSHLLLKDIIGEVCGRFKNLNAASFVLQYSLGDYPKCLVESDLDVVLMFRSFLKLQVAFIDIFVDDQLSVGKEVVLHSQWEHGSSSFNGSGVEDDNEVLSKFSRDRVRTLLSDGWRDYISHVGQKFEGGAKELREKLSKYAVEMGFDFVYVKNDKVRVTAECLYEGCDWRLHASLCRANGFFYIKKLNNFHSCRSLIRSKNKQVNSKFVSPILVDEIKGKPLVRPIDIVKDFKKNYGVDISYRQAWYGKEMAKTALHGDEALSYSQLSWYVDSINATNPGSVCVLERELDSKCFKRLFIAYGACIHGFQYCRPLLSLDGTFLKGKYRGTLLLAVGKNGNEGLFPLAFAIVDSENDDNWEWFLRMLAIILNGQRREVTFISDRHQGLVYGVPKVFPLSGHGYCLFHLKNNILSKYGGKGISDFRESIVSLFVRCAYAPTVKLFDENMSILLKEGGKVIERFLENIPKENWACAFFRGRRYGEMCSNVAESFNSWILEERSLPIMQLLEGIRIKMMKTMADRSLEGKTWKSALCPKMEKLLTDLFNIGKNWSVVRSSEYVFEVHSDVTLRVDLSNRSCSCCDWQFKGFPCAHAVVAFERSSFNVLGSIEEYFTTAYFQNSYFVPISPIPDFDRPASIEEEDVVKPPATKKQPGRPKKKRIKSIGENLRRIKCSHCKVVGNHNRKSCQATI